MKQTADGKYMIDFKFRYMQEDLPFGLVVMKGIASIAGVETPTMDKVIMWAQKVMGKLSVTGKTFRNRVVYSFVCDLLMYLTC